MPRLRSAMIAGIALWAALVLGGPTVGRASPWYEGFEGPEPSWEAAGGDARFRLLVHKRVAGEALTGDRCERLAISASAGTHVYFSHDVGRPRVLDELLPSVQIKSDRGGLEILARVVLPRTQDPQTGHPVSALVHGSRYTAVGRWQQLRIQEVPELLARQTRILRAQLGAHVDPREAYVDRVLLNVYGGPGVTNVWIDDLDIAGCVESQPGGTNSSSPNRKAEPPIAPAVAEAGVRFRENFGEAGSPGRRRVRLDGSTLLLDGRPMFARIIQHQGEPLGLLKRLGFNAVWLDRLPEAELLDEAKRIGLWVVCPPPRPAETTSPSAAEGALPAIGAAYEPVLAWDLGRRLAKRDLAQTQRWAEQVSLADRDAGRPTICQPWVDLWTYSRSVDLLLIGRSPMYTSFELADYATWLRERPRLARPGTPIWTTIQTQPDPGLCRQWSGLGQGTPPLTVCREQIQLLVYMAIAAGSRGLYFESHCPLDAADPGTRSRAGALELLNLELSLIEPWLLRDGLVTTVRGEEPEATGAVLQTDRARLLMPLWVAPGAQFVASPPAGDPVSFVVPGVPESNDAYLLMPGGLERFRPKRVTRGTRVILEEFALGPLVLFTQDPLVASRMSQRTSAIVVRAAQLERDLATARLEAVEQVLRRLSPAVVDSPQAAGWLAAARKSVHWADGFLASGDYSTGYRHARRATVPLRLLERAQWEAAVALLSSPVCSPGAVSFGSLPQHRKLMEEIATIQPGPNRLLGGDFEDLGTMLGTGWEHFQPVAGGVLAEGAGIVADAELAATAARSGQYGLRLIARAAKEGDQQPAMETPPCWIRSAPVPVEAGQWVRIHGWVQVPSGVTGSVDGLLIFDSLSGEALAQRVYETGGWQEFTLYRVAPQRGYVNVTLALSGLGEAWVDDLTVHPVSLQTSGFADPDITRLPRTLSR